MALFQLGIQRERGLSFVFVCVVGLDLVLHSMTKYMGGHTDLLGGVVVGRSGCVVTLRGQPTPVMQAVRAPQPCWNHIGGAS